MTYAESWGLLGRLSIDTCRRLVNFEVMDLASCMDAECDLHDRKRIVMGYGSCSQSIKAAFVLDSALPCMGLFQ